MPMLVHFGAGNIGRSLVAPLFRAAGYEVLCIDTADEVVAALNARDSYRVVIKDTLPVGVPNVIEVTGVRALHGSDTTAVAAAVANADLCSTAVGPAALPSVARSLAAGIVRRTAPLNVILCENVRHGATLMRRSLQTYLDASALAQVGLVETSIGKMVPIMPADVRARDPLEVWAEAYNEIIADADGFIGRPPEVPGLVLKHHFAAYVDRKLFVHNLGHAATAYFGFLAGARYIWEAIEVPHVRARVEEAMKVSARALHAQYHYELAWEELQNYLDDLLRRFANRALGDTVFRVGRDLPRKLAPDDRCVGAVRLVCAHGGDPAPLCAVIAAALHFAARDENGQLFPPDHAFHADFRAHGLVRTLQSVAGLDPARDAHLLTLIETFYHALRNPQ
ncbi:MAG: mannitol-1-phosphate 5-dehydrogenase [bacterium]|nr:mannitol-1-phosphate 5-dehydrogenase [bacterium]